MNSALYRIGDLLALAHPNVVKQLHSPAEKQRLLKAFDRAKLEGKAKK